MYGNEYHREGDEETASDDLDAFYLDNSEGKELNMREINSALPILNSEEFQMNQSPKSENAEDKN
jgi:hypothetical protein